MPGPVGRKRWRLALLAAAGYAAIGLLTSAMAGAATSSEMRSGWRLAGWLLSLAVFSWQIVYSRRRKGDSRLAIAVEAAVAVGFGAFLLAGLGPVRSHWSSGDVGRTALLSLVVWPFLTGIPALVAAVVLTLVLDRLIARDDVPGRVDPI